MPSYLNASQLAKRWGYSRQHVSILIKKNAIPASQLVPNGQYQIALDWIESHESKATTIGGNINVSKMLKSDVAATPV